MINDNLNLISEVENVEKGSVAMSAEGAVNIKAVGMATTTIENLTKQNGFVHESVDTFDLNNPVPITTEDPSKLESIDVSIPNIQIPTISEPQPTTEPVIDMQMPTIPSQVVAQEPTSVDSNLFAQPQVVSTEIPVAPTMETSSVENITNNSMDQSLDSIPTMDATIALENEMGNNLSTQSLQNPSTSSTATLEATIQQEPETKGELDPAISSLLQPAGLENQSNIAPNDMNNSNLGNDTLESTVQQEPDPAISSLLQPTIADNQSNQVTNDMNNSNLSNVTSEISSSPATVSNSNVSAEVEKIVNEAIEEVSAKIKKLFENPMSYNNAMSEPVMVNSGLEKTESTPSSYMQDQPSLLPNLNSPTLDSQISPTLSANDENQKLDNPMMNDAMNQINNLSNSMLSQEVPVMDETPIQGSPGKFIQF